MGGGGRCDSQPHGMARVLAVVMFFQNTTFTARTRFLVEVVPLTAHCICQVIAWSVRFARSEWACWQFS